MARADVQPSPNRCAAFILSSTSNWSWPLAAAVFRSFLVAQVSSKGFMIPLEAMFNLAECDLGKMLSLRVKPLTVVEAA